MGERFVEKSDFETFKFNIRKSIKAKGRKLQIKTRTLSGNLTLKTHDRRVQFIDPGGGNRDVTLPAEADSGDLFFFILNTANAAEDLVVKDDSTATIVTISQNEGGIVFCNGIVWRGFIGGIT